MLATLIAVPLLGGFVLFHSAVLSRTPLLQGAPDLVLLSVSAWALQRRVKTHWLWALIGGLLAGWATALPVWLYPLGYGLAVGLALLLRRRVWRAPLLAMFVTVFAGTLAMHSLTLGVLWINGVPIPPLEALNLVTLPSLVLNLLLSLPLFIFIRDLAKWIYPEELEI